MNLMRRSRHGVLEPSASFDPKPPDLHQISWRPGARPGQKMSIKQRPILVSLYSTQTHSLFFCSRMTTVPVLCLTGALTHHIPCAAHLPSSRQDVPRRVVAAARITV